GLCDGLRQPIDAELFIDTGAVQKEKLAALAEHRTQQEWLDVSQGMNSYLRAMDEMSRAVGKMSRKFKHAEGWRRHSHLGFCSESEDPLAAELSGAHVFRKSKQSNLLRVRK